MRILRTTAGLGVLAAGAAALAVGSASAANSPTFRDCSFIAGLDPDFVQLSGATPGPGGSLTVPASQSQVQVESSESADPGDSSGHDTLKVTVTAPNVAARSVSGAGTGRVVLAVPLGGAAPGSSYTIAWVATFDNGNHQCPSSSTPQNTTAHPFVLSVSPVAATPAPTAPVSGGSGNGSSGTTTPTKHSKKATCRTRTERVHGHKRKVRVCTKPKHKRHHKRASTSAH